MPVWLRKMVFPEEQFVMAGKRLSRVIQIRV
jgi:hypothetical protein